VGEALGYVHNSSVDNLFVLSDDFVAKLGEIERNIKIKHIPPFV